MEFGSDFHRIYAFAGSQNEIDRLKPVYFADGRMSLQHIILKNGYKRVWVPQYFCYDVLNALTKYGIILMTYPDFPEADDEYLIDQIEYQQGDAILRMNYFGLRDKRDNSNIGVAVIEDHSHGLMSNWANHSNAKYCIASLRKSIPIPEGGIAWSPQLNRIEEPPQSNQENERLVADRLKAMNLKREYLNGGNVDKSLFRNLFISSEDKFDTLPICGISNNCLQMLDSISISAFEERKKKNWNHLTNELLTCIEYLSPENDRDTPFSLVLRFSDAKSREVVRKRLINNNVFPAILWTIPNGIDLSWPSYLSVHCDGRYNDDEISQIASIINDAYKN